MIVFIHHRKLTTPDLMGLPAPRFLDRTEWVGMCDAEGLNEVDLVTWFTRVPIRMPVRKRES